MIIKSIELKNFRSYSEKTFALDEKTNVFYGKNAQGKTNILEAVYVCAFGKSFRTRKDSEMVLFNSEYGETTVEFCDSEREKKINFLVSEKNKKQIKINGIKQTRISEIYGNLFVVLFSPEDMNFAKGEPGIRRKGFDMFISQMKPAYMHSLQEYYKVLEQRNTLIKEKKESLKESELDFWDEKLAELNIKISLTRRDYVEKIIPIFFRYHKEISNEKEDVKIEYKTQIKNKAEEVIKDIKDRCMQDLKRGYTSMGIHRDDYVFSINGENLGDFGSQGQIRTAILALKLAEKDLFFEEKGEMPILLLDDVMSELDVTRREYLYEKLKDCQVLITCTDKIENTDAKLFEITKLVQQNK